MRLLQETSIEWALKHITRYYDSDFFPRLFEVEALANNWPEVKAHIASIDLEKYAPQTPFSSLALKKYSTFRVVHQLDPIDSIIYTALLYECSQKLEAYRIPEDRLIACSYRVKPDVNGSFFGSSLDGYQNFKQQSEKLAQETPEGCVVVCDITDFYNQIYLHRVSNVLSEAGVENADTLESFLSGLNTNTSRGVPVGPAPSILVAEAIMADIDSMILKVTPSFTRYVDDIHVFFHSASDARFFLHELTRYLHDNHRLVLSSEKTFVISSKGFVDDYLMDPERQEQAAIHERLAELSEGAYLGPDELISMDDLESKDQFKLRAAVYKEILTNAIENDRIDFGVLRHVLRKAGSYRMRNLLPIVLKNFGSLLPVVREVVVYVERVLNEKHVQLYAEHFNDILAADYVRIPFINVWVFTMFQNSLFNQIELKIDYARIIRIREQALIALREGNRAWIKHHKNNLDVLGPWDKRAVLYAGMILSADELKHWAGIVSSKGSLLDKSVAGLAVSQNRNRQAIVT